MRGMEMEFSVYVTRSITKIMEKFHRKREDLSNVQVQQVEQLISNFNTVMDAPRPESTPTRSSSTSVSTPSTVACAEPVMDDPLYQTIAEVAPLGNRSSTPKYEEPIYATPKKTKRSRLNINSPLPGPSQIQIVEPPHPQLMAVDEDPFYDRVQDLGVNQQRRSSKRWTRNRRIRLHEAHSSSKSKLPVLNQETCEQYYIPLVAQLVNQVIEPDYESIEEVRANPAPAAATKSLYQNIYLNSVGAVKDVSSSGYLKLREAADIQCTLMQQASKAIDACDRHKRFCSGSERVLAEKILLLANYKHLSLVQNIRDTQYENVGRARASPESTRIGAVAMGNFQVPLSHVWTSREFDTIGVKCDHYFMVVASEGEQVLASEPVQLGLGHKVLVFNTSMKFERLEADFKIQLEVFHMRLQMDQAGGDVCGSRFTFNRRTSTNRSFRKVHYKDLITETFTTTTVPLSSFAKIGSHVITMSSLRESNFASRHLTSAQEPSPLQSSITFELTSSPIHLGLNRSGFLDVGTATREGRYVWDRRWCLLQGDTIFVYRSPIEEQMGQQADCRINLRNSLSKRVEIADRRQCARSRCLVIDVANDYEYLQTVRYFLRADTARDSAEWQSDLNFCLQLLQSWNELKYTSFMTNL